MKSTVIRALALLLALLLLPGALPAAAEEETEIEENLDEETWENEGEAAAGRTAGEEAVTVVDGWHFNAKGFLVGSDNPGEEYWLEDEENGVWQYSGRSLCVKITRFREEVKQKKKKKLLEYCVAEIWASAESPMTTISTDATEKKPAGHKQVSPDILVEKHPCVFAMSDDFYGSRLKNILAKTSARQPGIIIRNGEIRWEKTKSSTGKTARQRPCLDTLAVYGDGSMKTYVSDAMTAQEYLDKGATQVFAFGPWLISEGKINEKEATEGCGYYEQNEPLTGLGMVEPYHYIAIVLKGRPKDKYTGAHLSWLAEKMLEYGCTEALNLDGGGTATMMFNGKVVMCGIGDGHLRSMGSMITFGLKE